MSNRDRAGALLPVIDRANVWTQTASDPAFARWTARRNWIDSTLTLIEHEGDTQTSPLARLDHVIAKFVGNIDLTALATRDANGEGLAADLAPINPGSGRVPVPGPLPRPAGRRHRRQQLADRSHARDPIRPGLRPRALVAAPRGRR